MKCRKKCGLSFASTPRAGGLLTTSPSVGPPEQVCRRRGSGSMGCENHQGWAVPGKMWIVSSIQHCPELAWRGASAAAIGLRGSVLGAPFSWSTLFLCLAPFSPSPHSLLQLVPCLSPASSQLLQELQELSASSLNSPQPPHSTVAAAPSSISPLGTSPAASQPCDVMGPWTWRQVHGYPLPPSEGGLGRAQCSQSGDSNHVLLAQLLNGMAPPNHSYPAVSHKGRHICLPKEKASLCSAHIAPSLPQFCFWTDPPCPRTMSLPISCRPPLKTTFY